MRNLSLLLCFALISIPLGAQSNAEPTVVKSDHYVVTSWAGSEKANETLALMEALLQRYNQLFLFDLSKLPAPLAVTLYSSKEDFVKALEGTTASPPEDFVFLQYTDPAQSVLAGWNTADLAHPLAFQGFYQYLWSFLPRSPSWIETGLAYHFWNVSWDGTSLGPVTEEPFLDALQARWATQPVTDLSALLTAPAANELDSWALVTFLLQSTDPVYPRILGSILGNLAPAATLEANRQSALQRFQSGKSLSTGSKDLAAYWAVQTSFSTLLAQGVAKMKDKDYAGALKLFQSALVQRPADDQARYYAGLASYELKDYPQAEAAFALVSTKTLPAGLLEYAKGLTAYAQKKWDDAKTNLAKAIERNETDYKKAAQTVLDLIK
ncbi:MAG: tetratricopeptide repeat protein [Spirochaetales bacterium]